MKDILENIFRGEGIHDATALQQLVREIRPGRHRTKTFPAAQVENLIALFKTYPALKESFAQYLVSLLSGVNHLNAYTESGILPNTGFFSESYRRFIQKVLPPLRPEKDLQFIINKVFPKSHDYQWLSNIPDELLVNCITLLDIKNPEAFANTRLQIINAIAIISHRISSLGLEPEISDRLAKVEKLDSPFILQGYGIPDYLESLKEGKAPSEVQLHKLLNLLNECDDLVEEIRNQKGEIGASLQMTFIMVRLRQHIQRAKILLLLLHPESEDFQINLVKFIKILVKSENQKDSIFAHINQNIDLLAVQVVENAARTGEHYITNNRKEYKSFFKASMGGGFIVGFLAIFKLLFYYMKLAPAWQAFLYSMNYSFGFILIHVTHSALATKQPAMTASAIAGSIGSSENDEKKKSLTGLALMIGKVFRSQFVSFMGNLLLCFPMGVLLALLWRLIFGEHIADVYKAYHMVEEIHPYQSLSLFHAAIAGVCLFLSGLISGYFDNLVVYKRIAERLREHPVLKKFLPTKMLATFSRYIEHNLGSLAGNFFLGVFLGTMSTIGFFFGLPLDIRHITFSAASFGIGIVGLNFDLSLWEYLISIIGIIGIGFFNFTFSFGLAFIVAVKSRKVSFKQTRRFFVVLKSYFLRHPFDFLFPPKEERSIHP